MNAPSHAYKEYSGLPIVPDSACEVHNCFTQAENLCRKVRETLFYHGGSILGVLCGVLWQQWQCFPKTMNIDVAWSSENLYPDLVQESQAMVGIQDVVKGQRSVSEMQKSTYLVLKG